MHYAIKSSLVDLIVIYQTMGDEERANTIGDALDLIKALESDLKTANERIELLETKDIRKQVRVYHGR